MDGHRSEVRVHLQLFSQSKQTLLGTQTCVRIVPARPTDGAEQNGVGGFAELDCLGRKRRSALIERAATDQSLAQLERVIPPLGHRAKHANALGYNLRPDPVAWEERNRQRVHTRTMWVDSYAAIAS